MRGNEIMTKEQTIINRINYLREQLEKIRSPKRLKENLKAVGNCFKYHNSYGSGERWWLYAKVVSADDCGVKAFQFQDTGGRLEVEKRFHLYAHMSGYEPISENEFYTAWQAFKAKIIAPL